MIDASMALAWFVDEDPHPDRDDALEYATYHDTVAPANFYPEVTHGLLRAERRGRIEPSLSLSVLNDLFRMRIKAHAPDPRVILEIARGHKLTANDASYLAAAIELGAPVATADSVLRKAAASLGLLWAPPKRKRGK